MMDPIWYMAYIPVFLIGVLAGYGSGRVSGERELRAAKNKKCPHKNCEECRAETWTWPYN